MCVCVPEVCSLLTVYIKRISIDKSIFICRRRRRHLHACDSNILAVQNRIGLFLYTYPAIQKSTLRYCDNKLTLYVGTGDHAETDFKLTRGWVTGSMLSKVLFSDVVVVVVVVVLTGSLPLNTFTRTTDLF